MSCRIFALGFRGAFGCDTRRLLDGVIFGTTGLGVCFFCGARWRDVHLILLVLLLVACYIGPAIVRAGCRKSAEVRETFVWRQLDPRVTEILNEKARAKKRNAVTELAAAGGAALMGAVRSGLRAVGLAGDGGTKPAAAGSSSAAKSWPCAIVHLAARSPAFQNRLAAAGRSPGKVRDA